MTKFKAKITKSDKWIEGGSLIETSGGYIIVNGGMEWYDGSEWSSGDSIFNYIDIETLTIEQETKQTTEKAKELVGNYRKEILLAKYLINGFVIEELSKQCALIAVDEIINTLNYDIRDLDVRGSVLLDLIKYWREVKTEINKL